MMLAGVLDVGRPKKQAKADAARPAGPKTIGVRATGEWADWLERLAKHNRTDIAKLVDAAVVSYAKATGFDEAPPERIP